MTKAMVCEGWLVRWSAMIVQCIPNLCGQVSVMLWAGVSLGSQDHRRITFDQPGWPGLVLRRTVRSGSASVASESALGSLTPVPYDCCSRRGV